MNAPRTRLRIWPSIPVDVHTRPPSAPLPFPLDDPARVQLFSRARYGLRLGLEGTEIAPGDEVLVPAYHHGSEVEALARAGLECRFYDVGDALAPDEEELAALVGPRTRALYIVHYFGFGQDAMRWRSWCDERGLLLIEDVAQSWLGHYEGQPLGSFGDLSIFCFYKTLGLPDGAGVASAMPPPAPSEPRVLGVLSVTRSHAEWLSGRSNAVATLDEALSRVLRSDHARRLSSDVDFQLDDVAAAPRRMSRFLLPRLVSPSVSLHRRENYRRLLEELGEWVPEPFRKLPEGACPLIFPIDAARAPAHVRDRLTERRIDASRFWQNIHPLLPEARYPGARRWRRDLLALPVHQELRDEDLERITAAAHARARRARPGASNHGEAHFDSVRDEWDDLAAATKNIFATWEWAATWWRHFGGADRRLLITPVREGGQTVAILPLYLSTTRPLRTIRFVGHGPSDQLGPVCASVDLPRAADAFRNVLRDTEPRWDVFRGDDIPTEWSRLLNGHLVASVASPLIRFNSETWDGFLATLSSRFRHEIRHDQRALERLHSVRFRLASSASLGADLDTLFKLHAARWRRSDFLLRNQEFHREFARRALDRGWLRLWFLEIDGSPVAVWYGFRFEGVEFHYQAGRDPTWTKYSVGLVLLSHTIRQALEDGITEYRFLRGAESYKYRFTNEESEVDTIVLSRTIPGKAAEAAWRLQRKAVHTVEQHERSRAVAARSRAAIAKARDRW